jgi:hypothetical protein
MLPVQRNQVSPEHQVVTDKHGEPGAELDGHGLVVRGSQTESGDAILSGGVGKLQDAEQGGAIAAQCKLLFPDSDLVQTQNFVQGVDELYVRDRFERTGRGWRFDESQLFSGDKISVNVGQKLAILHVACLLCFGVMGEIVGENCGTSAGMML